jgi:hypothetical protein
MEVKSFVVRCRIQKYICSCKLILEEDSNIIKVWWGIFVPVVFPVQSPEID